MSGWRREVGIGLLLLPVAFAATLALRWSGLEAAITGLTPQPSFRPRAPDAAGRRPENGSAGRPPAGIESWAPSFRDDFERHDLGPDWLPASGGWELRGGKLVSTSLDGPSTLICLAADFSGDLRVSYRARTVEPSPMGSPCDMSFLTNLPARLPVDPRGGYLFRFGSFLNTVTGLSRREEPLSVTGRVPIVVGSTHRVVFERRGAHFRMSVDGDLVVDGVDGRPLVDPEDRWGGFYVWRSVVEFDDLEVSKPGAGG